MIQNIIAGQKAEFERKLRESYVQRETVIKGLATDLIGVLNMSPKAAFLRYG